jgi:hypothetical protein
MTEMQSMPTGANGAAYVQLFQKAHQKIVTLDRLDEQLVQLFAKRQEAIDELRAIQAQIGQELETRVASRDESSGKVFAAVSAIQNGDGAAVKEAAHPHIQNRLVAQALMPSRNADGAKANEEADV